MYKLLDVNGNFFASSISIDALMLIMRGRWAGTVVEESTGNVLFDIKTDRTTKDTYVTAKQARDEAALARKRATTLAGYTQKVLAESTEYTLNLLVKPGTDFGERFEAWDTDEQEWVTVNGWLFTVETSE